MSARGGRVFFDDHCGPCTFFARSLRGITYGRLEIEPLADPAADAALGRLTADVRHGAFHLWDGQRLFTGAEALVPLVGAVGGPMWAELVERIPPAESALRWLYLGFWRYRQTHGCARDAPRVETRTA